MRLNGSKKYQDICGCILVGFSFFVLTLLTVKTLAPDINTDAATQTASQTIGPYTMSMANDSVATIDITPTSTQTVYSASNNLSVTNTCSAGATITLTTNSTTSNNLTRVAMDSDTLTKDIAATTTTGLDNNSWGYSIDNGSNYYAVPKKGGTAATIYDGSAAISSTLSVSVKFGVKMDNTLPAGSYINDVVYTMTPKAGCLSYGLTWDMDGGTRKSGATYPTSLSWGATVNLSQLTPTRDGYTFAGWTNGSSDFTGSETAANLNPNNALTVTIKALWVKTVVNFDYTGGEQIFAVPATGYYKLEVWGAQGGYWTSSADARGGYGGYSIGVVKFNKNENKYVNVGGSGTVTSEVENLLGGYNGGGNGYYWRATLTNGAGGGATHIASTSGQLKTLSQNVSSVLIVAGGGGGGGSNGYDGDVNNHPGGNGGGIRGGDGKYADNKDGANGLGGTQSAGGAYDESNMIVRCNNGQGRDYTTFHVPGSIGSFGQGGNGWVFVTDGGNVDCDGIGGGSGGGGGFYGGGGSSIWSGGGGGSGYIGNSNLISGGGLTKHMTCYSCSTSTDAATRTNSNTNVSATAIADYSKTGDGYARITYLGANI